MRQDRTRVETVSADFEAQVPSLRPWGRWLGLRSFPAQTGLVGASLLVGRTLAQVRFPPSTHSSSSTRLMVLACDRDLNARPACVSAALYQ